MPLVTLRPATADDREFCFQVHHSSMRDVVDAVWGWRDHEQRAFHVRVFDPSRTQIVIVDGIPAGVLIVEDRGESLYLSRIELVPSVQGRGIGSALIADLQRAAASRRRPLVLEVLNANPRAYALYRRLGFRETRRTGPKREMRWV